MRPLRWISGADGTNVAAEDPCVVNNHTVFCADSEGPTAQELVQGTTDLEVIDRQEVTVTRVVGNMTFNYSQYVDPFSPGWQTPIIRMGLLTVESAISVGGWVPPDLWDLAELEETSFMWLRQQSFERQAVWSPSILVAGVGQVYVREATFNVDVDVTVNRKIGRDGHLMLVVSKHFEGPPQQGVFQPLVSMTRFLRVLVKC